MRLKLFLLVFFLNVTAAILPGSVLAQEQKNENEITNWVTQCSSANRASPKNCSMEQRVILQETGRQIARFTVQAAADSKMPMSYLVHIPLGVSIRSGIQLKVDEREPIQIDIQTCDSAGCYAGDIISPDFQLAMGKGTKLAIIFSDLKKQEIQIPINLNGFTVAYETIR